MPPCRPLVVNAYRTCRLSSISDPKIAKNAFWGQKVEISQKTRIFHFFTKNRKNHPATHFLAKRTRGAVGAATAGRVAMRRYG